MPASDYIDQQVLAAIFQGGSFPAFANVYVSLFTVTPTKAGGGTEVVSGGYNRLAVASSAALWAITGPTYVASNIGLLDFGISIAAWGTLTAFGIHDAQAGGNLLFFDTFASPIVVAAGKNVVFNLAQLTVSGVP